MKGIENVSLVTESSTSSDSYLIVGDVKFWFYNAYDFSLFNFDLSKVRSVDVGSLSGFTAKLLGRGGVRPSDVFFDCGQDYDAIDGRYNWNCKPSSSIVRKDVLVAGWLLEDPFVNEGHGAGNGIEDIHYNLKIDTHFLDHIYGPNGLSMALDNAQWPGNPPAPIPLSFANMPPATPSALAVVDFNSWVLPVRWNDYDLHCELNAWHVNDKGVSFGRHWKGRGPQPASWINPFQQDSDAWFPFHPLDPEGLGRPLKKDDYILIRGTLWQDDDHGGYSGPWNTGLTVNHTGWSEMHPPDWIIRVRPPQSNVRLTKAWLSNATSYQSGQGEYAPEEAAFTISPDFQPSSSTKILRVRSVQQLIDARLTNAATKVTLQVQPFADHVEGHLALPSSKTQLRFKATWLVGWSEIDQLDQVWVNDQVPAGAIAHGDGEGWDWSTDNVFFGQMAHYSALAPGMHQHYFLGAASPMSITSSSNILFAMVYLDPHSPPDEVMLQWHTTDWLSRAYWGENLINFGTDGGSERLYMGPLPPTGEWIRLEVPASAVGLGSGTPQVPITVNGMAFTLSGGSAFWDYAGVSRVDQPRSNATFVSQSMPSSLEPGQTFSAAVVMTNTGSTTWAASGNTPYRLGAQNPQDNTTWGLSRVDVPTKVPSGASVTFNFIVTAPAQPGGHNLQWRMVNETIEWFGDFTSNVLVSVVNPLPSNQTTVPDVVEGTPAGATNAIHAAGLVPSFAGASGPNTWVASQSPQAGKVVSRGTTVTCHLRSGPIP